MVSKGWVRIGKGFWGTFLITLHPVLDTLLGRQRNDERTLRSDTSNKVSSTRQEAYSMNVEKLWNMSNEKFKNTNLLKVAKSEAKKLASSLPI